MKVELRPGLQGRAEAIVDTTNVAAVMGSGIRGLKGDVLKPDDLVRRAGRRVPLGGDEAQTKISANIESAIVDG